MIAAAIRARARLIAERYDADPKTNPHAQRFQQLSYDEVLARDLGVMDLTAICLCRDHQMPIVVFDMFEARALTRLALGENVGTRVGPPARPSDQAN